MSKYLINTDTDLADAHAEFVKWVVSHVNNPRRWPLEPREQARFIIETIEWAQRIKGSEPFLRAEVVRAARKLKESESKESMPFGRRSKTNPVKP